MEAQVVVSGMKQKQENVRIMLLRGRELGAGIRGPESWTTIAAVNRDDTYMHTQIHVVVQLSRREPEGWQALRYAR